MVVLGPDGYWLEVSLTVLLYHPFIVILSYWSLCLDNSSMFSGYDSKILRHASYCSSYSIWPVCLPDGDFSVIYMLPFSLILFKGQLISTTKL